MRKSIQNITLAEIEVLKAALEQRQKVAQVVEEAKREGYLSALKAMVNAGTRLPASESKKLKRRALNIVLQRDGVTKAEVARSLGVKVANVSNWLDAFAREGKVHLERGKPGRRTPNRYFAPEDAPKAVAIPN